MIYINQPLVRLLLHICYQSTVNMISLAQVWAAQWSNTIPSWNVWLQVKIHLTLFCFNTSTKPMICLGCNKDLWSRRSKYKSYGALRGCDLGVRDCLQVCCGQLYLFFQQCFWQLPNQLPIWVSPRIEILHLRFALVSHYFTLFHFASHCHDPTVSTCHNTPGDNPLPPDHTPSEPHRIYT